MAASEFVSRLENVSPEFEKEFRTRVSFAESLAFQEQPGTVQRAGSWVDPCSHAWPRGWRRRRQRRGEQGDPLQSAPLPPSPAPSPASHR